MDCAAFHYCGRSAYCLALAVYKVQFTEAWHQKIINIVKELNIFGLRIMLKNIIIATIVIFITVELVEHIIFPIVWYLLKGRKKSRYGVSSMIGKVVEIRRWDNIEGQVLINGELWNAVCEAPLPVGGKAVVQGIEGLTLKLKPYENS